MLALTILKGLNQEAFVKSQQASKEILRVIRYLMPAMAMRLTRLFGKTP
jgi:hypothetical protein